MDGLACARLPIARGEGRRARTSPETALAVSLLAQKLKGGEGWRTELSRKVARALLGMREGEEERRSVRSVSPPIERRAPFSSPSFGGRQLAEGVPVLCHQHRPGRHRHLWRVQAVLVSIESRDLVRGRRGGRLCLWRRPDARRGGESRMVLGLGEAFGGSCAEWQLQCMGLTVERIRGELGLLVDYLTAFFLREVSALYVAYISISSCERRQGHGASLSFACWFVREPLRERSGLVVE